MTEAVTQARCEAADARAEAQRARGDAEAASRGANATSIDSAAEATDTKLDAGAMLKELADAARRASDAEARATIAERELADLRAEVEADRAHASNGPPSRSLPEHVEPAKIDGARTPIHLSPKTGTGEMADETERAALAAEARSFLVAVRVGPEVPARLEVRAAEARQREEGGAGVVREAGVVSRRHLAPQPFLRGGRTNVFTLDTRASLSMVSRASERGKFRPYGGVRPSGRREGGDSQHEGGAPRAHGTR